MKTKKLCSVLFLVFSLDFASGDGLCGLEPPKDGGGCSAASPTTTTTEKQIEEKILEKFKFDEIPANETEIWERRFYPKISYTNQLDWSIRHELDDAEEFIAAEPDIGINKLEELLKKYPDSPRANYDMIRALQIKFESLPNTSEDEKLEHAVDIVNKYLDLIMRYKPSEDMADDNGDNLAEESLPLPVFSSSVHQALTVCDNANLTLMGAEIIEKVFDINPQFAEHERYHIVLIEKYFVLDDWESMETSVERALQKFPHSLLLKFYHGIILKKLDQKKEGNKILREIEFEGESAVQFADEIRQLGRALYNRGKVAKALNLFMETSKVHGFLSQYQRPVISIPDLEAIPLWNIDEQVSLTKHTEEFSVITDRWQEIQADALEVAKNMTDGWVSHTRSNHDQNLIVGSGNWSVFPLFTWGRSRPYNCFRASKSCSIIRGHFPTAAQFSTGTIKFEKLLGHTRVLPHCGPINSRLRMLLPLRVGTGFTYRIGKNTNVPFVEGEVVVVDDSFEHEMKNDGDAETIWLSLDFPHPDLTYEQEKKIVITSYAKMFFMTI